MSTRGCYAAALVFFIGGGWLSYSAAFDPDDGRRRTAEITASVTEYRRQNAHLALEIEEMQVLVEQIKTDPASMEELARRRLLMIKPGEIFVLPQASSNARQ